MNDTIKDIFTDYFEIIDDYFRSIKHHFGKEEDSHINLGYKMSQYPLISDLIIDAIEDIDETIFKFWKKNINEVSDFIKEQDVLKCVYSGKIAPLILEKFVKRSALYIDTVVLPDPLFNICFSLKPILINKKEYLNRLIRHLFDIWRLKSLILTDSPNKIIILSPINVWALKGEDTKLLVKEAYNKFTDYINSIFDRNFSDYDSAMEFLKGFKKTEQLFSSIKNVELLPNKLKNIKGIESFNQDFSRAVIDSGQEINSFGESLGLYFSSQFVRVQEHKFFCNKFIAEPIYDNNLAWFFFNYEMGGLDMDAAIASCLQKEEFDWISNVPLEALKVFREENELEYMRQLIRKGITDLKAKADKDLSVITKQLDENFKEAFSRQRAEIDTLQNRSNRIIKKEILITTGGFLAGFVPGLSNAISLVSFGKKIQDLINKFTETKEKKSKKEREFVNILMGSYEKKEN